VDQFPGVGAADPHFRGLKRECPILGGGPVSLGHQRDSVVKAEPLRVDLPGDYSRIAGSLTDRIQVLPLADHAKIAGDREIGILDARCSHSFSKMCLYSAPCNVCLRLTLPRGKVASGDVPAQPIGLC
jgi:hypothetical protein